MYNKSDYFYYKEDIASIKNFISKEDAESVIKFFNLPEHPWGTMPFYQSLGMGFAENDPRLSQFNLPEDFFSNLRSRFKSSVEALFDRELRPNTSHAQIWHKGGYAPPHSDSSDLEGNLNAFQINKYVGILYLNDNYGGGELYFPDHKISIKPEACELIIFPGGHSNIHGVEEITHGDRYTIVSFWDYADAEYSEELLAKWKEEEEQIRKEQEEQRKEWERMESNA